MSDDKAAALRALLDEAGLVVESIEPEEDGDGFGVTLAGGSGLWLAGDADACVVQAGHLRDDFATEHDTLAAALGLPSAAKVREMRAEVERLRGVVENAGAWRAEGEAEIEHLRAERDAAVARAEKAEANYAFMVERAADQRLDGYRMLGERAAAAENAYDDARRERNAAQADAAAMRSWADEAFDALTTMVPSSSWTEALQKSAEAWQQGTAGRALLDEVAALRTERDALRVRLVFLNAANLGADLHSSIMERLLARVAELDVTP